MSTSTLCAVPEAGTPATTDVAGVAITRDEAALGLGASRLRLQMPSGYFANQLAPLCSCSDVAAIQATQEEIIARMRPKGRVPLGWHLSANDVIRASGSEVKEYPFAYVGPRAQCAEIQEGTPGSLLVAAVDKRAGTGNLVVSRTAVAPHHLVADGRMVYPASNPAYGQMAIDLAHALDIPCLFIRPDEKYRKRSILPAWQCSFRCRSCRQVDSGQAALRCARTRAGVSPAGSAFASRAFTVSAR